MQAKLKLPRPNQKPKKPKTACEIGARAIKIAYSQLLL